MPDIIQRIQKLMHTLNELYTLEIDYNSFKISYEYSHSYGYDKYTEYFSTIDEVENYLVKEFEPTATFNKQ